MNGVTTRTGAAALVLACAGGELVTFPEAFAEGVRYATVERGNLKEEIFASRAALEAVKNGQPIRAGPRSRWSTTGMENCTAMS